MSGPASFMSPLRFLSAHSRESGNSRLCLPCVGNLNDNALVALDRRIHGDVGAPFVCKHLAKLKVLAPHRHLGLALELGRPMAKIIAVPWRLRCQRWQPEPLPD